MLDNKSKLIAIIPARGGSKRIPRKNIRQFSGVPIIAYTISAAINSDLFKQVIVSTDDQEIASISRKLGASVPFIREISLANDYTPISEVTLDAINKIDPDGKIFDSIAQLMPNCPLRNTEDILASYKQFRSQGAQSQISITRYGWQNPWWAFSKDDKNNLQPLFSEQLKKRSQDLIELFCPTGAIWWINAEKLRQEKTFHCKDCTGWEIAWDHSIDIDTEEDWIVAEILMNLKNGMK